MNQLLNGTDMVIDSFHLSWMLEQEKTWLGQKGKKKRKNNKKETKEIGWLEEKIESDGSDPRRESSDDH